MIQTMIVGALLALALSFFYFSPQQGGNNDTKFDEASEAIDQAKDLKLNREVDVENVTIKEVEVKTDNSSILDLSGQGLTKVPDYVFTKTDTQELNLSNNRLSGSLQAEVRHLSKLQILDLSDNNFTGVPAEVGQLKGLEILDLSNNSLTGLPYELGNLSNLKILDLRGNVYSKADLEVIKKGLPNTEIRVD
ncbi:MAG: leucine-rich repeat domain-containing protein [Candidatus Pacebacteria bacterium]|nr:leucine-rich repeat domain-containing protein [Candidatus Paceibacterota bacterium]